MRASTALLSKNPYTFSKSCLTKTTTSGIPRHSRQQFTRNAIPATRFNTSFSKLEKTYKCNYNNIIKEQRRELKNDITHVNYDNILNIRHCIVLLDKIWRYIDKKPISEQEKSKMKTTAILIDAFVIVPIMIITVAAIIIIQTAIKYM